MSSKDASTSKSAQNSLKLDEKTTEQKPAQPQLSGLEDDDADDDDADDNEDMEITEAIAIKISKKHSLSVAEQQDLLRRESLPARRRSSVVAPVPT